MLSKVPKYDVGTNVNYLRFSLFAGEIVMLRDLKSMNQNIFLTVDTTCPLPRSERPPTPKTPRFEPPPTILEDEVNIEDESPEKKASNKSRHHHKRHRKRGHHRHRHRDNLDQSEIPDWIKAEMENAEEIKGRHHRDEGHKHHGGGGGRHSKKGSSASDDNDDTLKRKMQRELEQKRKEYLLEAENVVRIREEAFNQELIKLQTELEHQKRLQAEHLQKLSEKNGTDKNGNDGNETKKDSEKCTVQ